MSVTPRDATLSDRRRGSRIKMANRRYQDTVRHFVARKPWFNSAETACLVKMFERNKDVLLNRSNTLAANKGKHECWIRITHLVNSKGGVNRSVAEVRKRWKDLLSRARKDYKLMEGAKRSHGPEPQLAPFSETIWRIYGPHLNVDRHDVYICDQQPRLRLSYGSSEGISPALLASASYEQSASYDSQRDDDEYDESMDHDIKSPAESFTDYKQDSPSDPQVILLSPNAERSREAGSESDSKEYLSLMPGDSSYQDMDMDSRRYSRYLEEKSIWRRHRDSELAEMRKELLLAEIEKTRLEKIKFESEIEKLEIEKENMALEREKIELEMALLKKSQDETV